MKKAFTRLAQEVMATACTMAASYNDTYIGTEYILAAMAETEGCTAQKILASNGINLEGIRKILKPNY